MRADEINFKKGRINMTDYIRLKYYEIISNLPTERSKTKKEEKRNEIYRKKMKKALRDRNFIDYYYYKYKIM